jgi:hypothetical protein
MVTIATGYDLNGFDTLITAFNARTALVEQRLATAEAATAAMIAFMQTLNSGNYYTKTEDDERFAAIDHAHAIDSITGMNVDTIAALKGATLADVRTALGLGSAAVHAASDFATADAVASIIANFAEANIEERARDAVGTAIEFQICTLYYEAGTGLFDRSGTSGWKLKIGNTVLASGSNSSTAPAIGWTKIVDDAADRIYLRQVTAYVPSNGDGEGEGAP